MILKKFLLIHEALSKHFKKFLQKRSKTVQIGRKTPPGPPQNTPQNRG